MNFERKLFIQPNTEIFIRGYSFNFEAIEGKYFSISRADSAGSRECYEFCFL